MPNEYIIYAMRPQYIQPTPNGSRTEAILVYRASVAGVPPSLRSSAHPN